MKDLKINPVVARKNKKEGFVLCGFEPHRYIRKALRKKERSRSERKSRDPFPGRQYRSFSE